MKFRTDQKMYIFIYKFTIYPLAFENRETLLTVTYTCVAFNVILPTLRHCVNTWTKKYIQKFVFNKYAIVLFDIPFLSNIKPQLRRCYQVKRTSNVTLFYFEYASKIEQHVLVVLFVLEIIERQIHKLCLIEYLK